MKHSLLVNPARFCLEKVNCLNDGLNVQINEFSEISLKFLENKTIKYFIICFKGLVPASALTLIGQCKLMFPSLVIIVISDEFKIGNNSMDYSSYGVDHFIYFQNDYEKLERDLITIAWHYESIQDEKFPVLQVQDLILNPNSKLVTRSGLPIKLTRKEFDLLEFLICNRGIVVDRMTILEVVWGYSSDTLSNTVDVHFARLRNKIDAKFNFKFLYTIHCVGYKFDANLQSALF